MTAQLRILMCSPDHYDVDYVINPWMEGNVHKSSRDRAVEQWQKLYNEGGITALANRPVGRPPMSQLNIKALLKKPISQLTPAEMRRRLEYAEAEAAYLKKLEALAQSKAAQKNKPKSLLS